MKKTFDDLVILGELDPELWEFREELVKLPREDLVSLLHEEQVALVSTQKKFCDNWVVVKINDHLDLGE